MSTASAYPVVLRPLSQEDGGGWIAIVPDLPGCLSDGESPERALHNVEAAIEEWLDAARSMGRSIPKPDASLSISLTESVPDHVRAHAENYARQIAADPSATHDPGVMHALIAAWAKAAAKQFTA
jgi:antitoxin HicB